MREINEGIQNTVYFSRHPTVSHNGFYPIFAGETLPSPEYYMYRTERSGIFWGGVYVYEYILSGKGYIEADGEVYTVYPGDFVFMNAQKNIEYYPDKDTPYRKLWVNFAGPLIHGVTDALQLTRSVYIARYDAENDIRSIHRALANIRDDNKNEQLDYAANLVLGLLLRQNNFQKCGRAAPQTAKKTAERIKEYIDSLILPNIWLDDIAERFSLNKNYIIHCFKKEYGIAPGKYITRRKTEAAKLMLTEMNMSISAAAEELKYCSTQHFTRVFRECCRMTPGEYKAAYGTKKEQYPGKPE